MLLSAAFLVAAAAAPPGPEALAPMPNLYRPPTRCGALHDDVLRRIRAATGGRPPLLQYAVMRQVDGCPVPSPAGYRQDYLLPGAADAPRRRRPQAPGGTPR